MGAVEKVEMVAMRYQTIIKARKWVGKETGREVS